MIILLTDKLTVNSNSVFVEITNTSRAEKEKKKKSCLNCGSIVVRVISLIKTDCLQASGKVEERHVVRSAGISSLFSAICQPLEILAKISGNWKKVEHTDFILTQNMSPASQTV